MDHNDGKPNNLIFHNKKRNILKLGIKSSNNITKFKENIMSLNISRQNVMCRIQVSAPQSPATTAVLAQLPSILSHYVMTGLKYHHRHKKQTDAPEGNNPNNPE
jgi:hypothetical protein